MAITFGDDTTIGDTYEKYGLVCAMDVLGVRKNTLDEARIVLENVTTLINQFKLQQMEAGWIANRNKELPIHQEWQYYSKLAPIDVFVAGDTFFICCRFDDERLELAIPKATGSILTFFRLAMQMNMMMRGAISIGDYLWRNGEELVLGPAINDAVEHCEQADWIGLHLTEKAGKILEKTMDAFRIGSKQYFMQYQVPLSKPKCACRGECLNFATHAEYWCVNWPLYFCSTSRDPLHSIGSGRTKIESILSKNKLSSGKAVSKYTNASAFLKPMQGGILIVFGHSTRMTLTKRSPVIFYNSMTLMPRRNRFEAQIQTSKLPRRRRQRGGGLIRRSGKENRHLLHRP